MKTKLEDKRLAEALKVSSILSFEAKLTEYATQLVYLKSSIHKLDSLVFSAQCNQSVRYASDCFPLSDNDQVLVRAIVESFTPEAATDRSVKVVCGALGELHGELDRTTQQTERTHLWNIMTKLDCQQRQ